MPANMWLLSGAAFALRLALASYPSLIQPFEPIFVSSWTRLGLGLWVIGLGSSFVDCSSDELPDESGGADWSAVEDHAACGCGPIWEFRCAEGDVGGKARGTRLGFSDSKRKGTGLRVVEFATKVVAV